MVIQSNIELAAAFPSSVREEARAAIAALPESPHPFSAFSVRVAGETVLVPQRIYHDPLAISVGYRLGLGSQTKKAILDSLFSRHTDGFVREKRLSKILRLDRVWIPPFVIQLAGEYVVEILRLIEEAIPELDSTLYREFVRNNPEFIKKTKQRIVSYWNCYYRSIPRERYPGFPIYNFLEQLQRKGPALTPGPKLKS